MLRSILCNPTDCSLPDSSVHGILQARITRVSSLSLLQWIILAQESNQGLLHCRQILHQLSYQGRPLLFQRIFLVQELNPHLFASPTLASEFFTTAPSWKPYKIYQFSSVQSLSRVWFFATPWTTACQTSLSFTNSWSLLKIISIKSVMPSNHLILCHPLLLLPSIFPSIRVFSKESVLPIRWPKYWSFCFNIRPSNI